MRAPTIALAWLDILDLILKYGEEKQTEYPVKQKEIANLVSIIEGKDQSLSSWFNFSEEDLKNII